MDNGHIQEEQEEQEEDINENEEPGTPTGPPPEQLSEHIHTFTLPLGLLQGLMMNSPMDTLNSPMDTLNSPMDLLQPPLEVSSAIPIPHMFSQHGSLEEQITNQSFHEQKKYKQVAEKDFINSLSVQKVTPGMVEKKVTCGICLDELQLDEDIIELPCKDKHYFHIKKEECPGIYPWLKENNTCPLCRHEFPSEEKEVEQEEISHEPIEPQVMPSINDIRRLVHRVIDEEEDRRLQEALYASLHK